MLAVWQAIRDALIPAVRTGAAALAGFIITFLLDKGWDFPDDIDSQINLAVFLAVTGLYNILVNLAAKHIHPAFGFLLIVPKQPVYPSDRGVLVPENADGSYTVTGVDRAVPEYEAQRAGRGDRGSVLYVLLVLVVAVVLVILLFALLGGNGK